MKYLASCLFAFLLFSTIGYSQTKEQQKLLELDLGWENALLKSDVAFLENLLADDFIWVHNHAGQIDGKEAAVSRAKRIQAGQADDTKGRVSRDQKVVILGNTGVVSGYTVVDRGPSPVTYHFMRTYALVDGKFKLLGNHTMAIPNEEVK
ncbi:MAG: nuclear transport factor 2 family protein [Algoriphagus sp.]|nr:nuclear transport factor 2 family protein [Algoriphagus sp.]